MSLIIFFGFTSVVILVGFIYAGLTIRHHWKNSKKTMPNAKGNQ